MKKAVSLLMTLLALIMAFCVAGCSGEEHYVEDEDLTQYVKLPDYKNLTVDTTTLAFNMAMAYENYKNVSQLDVEIKNEGLDDGFVAIMDTAIIDYVGKKDGVPFEGGSAKGFDLVIGSGQFIKGFEEGLIGVKVGETVDLNLTFPKDYTEASLAGKPVVFTVTVKGILRPEIPEVDDEMAGWLGYESAKAYKEGIKNEYIGTLVWQNFMEGVEVIKYPEYEIDRFVEDNIESTKETAEAEGTEYEQYILNAGYENENAYIVYLNDYAKAYLKIKMACYLYAKNEGITVTEKELDEYIKNNYSEEDEPEDDEIRKIKDSLIISRVREKLIAKVTKG